VPAPLDAAAAGVASLLTSLRTRAGLQEDRLTGTELRLDPLAGLPLVREFAEQGESEQQAIIQAVKMATGLLPPTLSIVADVVLCLRVLGDAVPDPELYAPELGQRREALLRNWVLLHELRSVTPVPKKPRPRTLRLDLEATALGELARILTAAGPEAAPAREAAQTEGSQLPSGPGGAAITSPRGAVSPAEPAQARLIEIAAGPPLLYQTLQDVQRAIRSHLIVESGQPVGWRHDLRQAARGATAMATAYGLKAMVLLDGHLPPDLVPLVEALRRMAVPEGGYATGTHGAPRPEVTATVMEALHAVDGTADLHLEFAAIERDLGAFERGRPYVLATVLESVLRVRPDSALVDRLVNELLASRSQYDQFWLWPEKVLDAGMAPPTASPVHTARAVRALALVQAVHPSTDVADAMSQGAAWLALENPPLASVSEYLDRPVAADRVEPQYFRHFTAAWAVKALVSVGFPASHPTVSSAIALIWQSFAENASLFAWANGDWPIWMSYDAVEALRLASLATPIRPGRSADR
jgi:hypothetical protein